MCLGGSCTYITASEGYIQSQNYPDDYGNGRNCNVTINTISGARTRIELDFISFNVEQDYDYVSVKYFLKSIFITV